MEKDYKTPQAFASHKNPSKKAALAALVLLDLRE
jgi:hypothetical protein